MSSNEIICSVEGCQVVCKDVATLEEHQLSHRVTIDGTTYRPSIFTGTPSPLDARPSTSGLKKPYQPVVQEEPPLTEQRRRDDPMDLENQNVFSDVSSDDDIEEVRVIGKKKMIGLTYKQI